MSIPQKRLSTGVRGLDNILGGGLNPRTSTLIRGAAGTGKTTLGLQFLAAGVSCGEAGVYVSFEEFPEHLYKNASQFGLDLPAMERAGKLQIVTMAPDVFMEEAVTPGGVLEELKSEIGMQRIVIDSLTLLEANLASSGDGRRSTYLLRNALQRLGVTNLLLEERQPTLASDSTTEYVVDTVIYLTLDELDLHRLRHIEVRKHRGSPFQSGKHIFVFAENGIRVLPAMDRIPDLTVGEVVPTGLTLLDQCLGGGIPRGKTFAINVNSRCNFRYLAGTIMSAHLRQGDGVISTRCAMGSPSLEARLLSLYGYDAAQLGAEGRWTSVEFMDHPVSRELEPYIIKVPHDPSSHQETVDEVLLSRWRGETGNAKHWLWMADMNFKLRSFGRDNVVRAWPELVEKARFYGHTIIAICKFEEMGTPLASFVQHPVDGILRMWFDGRYQYLQVQKAPNGRVSEPMVIEFTETPPYMILW